MSNYENRLNDNNLNLMNIMNTVSNLPDAGGGSGDVKLFDSIANMQADPNPVENGLAIVYYGSIGNLTADTEFQVATFPETVTLPSAVAGYIDIGFVAVDGSSFDCWGSLSPRSFSMSIHGSGSYSIRYTSSDGINYTRTQISGPAGMVSGNDVDFGTIIKFGNRYGDVEWNDAIGYFMQMGSVEYQGLFQYKNNSYSIAKTQLDVSPDYVYGKTFYGNNGVEFGNLQANTGLNIQQIQFRRDIINKYQVMGISDASNLFANYTLYNQTNSSYFDTSDLDMSNITNTSCMFINCKNITDSIELNTTNVTNMNSMFNRCGNLSNPVNISNFDTSNVKDIGFMFFQCQNLTSIPNFNTINVTNAHGMFYYCVNVTSVPNFNTSNIIDMGCMFESCQKLQSVPNFNTTNTKIFAQMFGNCRNLTTIPNFNTSNATNMNWMFYGCYNLTSISNFDTSNVNSIASMFYWCQNLTSVPHFDTSNVTNMGDLFQHCNSLTNVPNFDTSNVVNMSNLFANCSNVISVPNYNTDSAKNMVGMFAECHNITSIPNYNTSNVIQMAQMFVNCINLVDVPQLDTHKVTWMAYMFGYCNNLSDASIQNIINMCLNSNIPGTHKNLSNTNSISPFCMSNITSSRYSNRLDELTSAGWTY